MYRVDVYYDQNPSETRWVLKEYVFGTVRAAHGYDTVQQEYYVMQEELPVRGSMENGTSDGKFRIVEVVDSLETVLHEFSGDCGRSANYRFTIP